MKLCLHVCNNMGNGIPADTSEIDFWIYQCNHRLILPSFALRKELVYGYLGVILIEARKESSLQIDSRLDGTRWKAFELVKGHSFESTDKQSGHDSVIIYYITNLGPEVIDV